MISSALLIHAAPVATLRYSAALGCPVVNVTAGAYSGSYDEHTGLAARFPTVAAALAHFAPSGANSDPLALVAFSAGCWALRGWLRDAASRERVTCAAFIDGLHAGGTDARAELGPQHEGVLEYARAAVAGYRTLVVLHSQIVPPGYASTRATADALLAALGLSRPGRLGTFTAGGFVVIGSPGDDAAAHSRELLELGPAACARFLRPALERAGGAGPGKSVV